MKNVTGGGAPVAGLTIAAILLASMTGYVCAFSHMFQPVGGSQKTFEGEFKAAEGIGARLWQDIPVSFQQAFAGFRSNPLFNPTVSSPSTRARDTWSFSLDRAGDRRSLGLTTSTSSNSSGAINIDTSRSQYSSPVASSTSSFLTTTGEASITGVTPAAPNATKYWDVSAGAGNGVGGSATWSTQADLLWSDSSTGDAVLTAAATTDAGIFEGTAGTITLGFSPTLASWTFNVTNYTLTTNVSGTNRTVTGPFSLASNVNLNFGAAADTTTRQITIAGSVSGAAGSSLTIRGNQASSATSGGFRLNLSGTNNSISVPIIISQSGTGVAGIVATGTGEQITGTITNNGTGATMLGATSGNDLTISGVISGTAPVRFQGDVGTNSSGTGTVTLSVQNNYSGATIINVGSTGTVKLGVDDALPTTTSLQFGAASTSGVVGSLDLNGKNQTIGSLSSVTTSAHTIKNTSATLSTLTIQGNANTTFSGSIGAAGANNLALTKGGTGFLILSGTNTYTGDTTIKAGELILAASGSLATNSTIRLGDTAANSPSAMFTFGATGGGETIANPTIVQASASGTEGTRTILGLGTSGNTNTWSGNITLNTDLVVQSTAVGGTVANGPGILLFQGGTINVADNTFIVNSNLQANNADTYSIQGNVVVNEVLSSSLVTGGGVFKEGSGTLILQGTSNTYTGTDASNLNNAAGTRIGLGILAIFGDGSLGLAPTNATNNVYFVAPTTNTNVDSIAPTLRADAAGITLAATRNINIASGVNAQFDSNGNTFTVAGNVNGGGNLTKTGAGTLILSGANSYTGTTTINAGTLNAATANALGSTSSGTSNVTVNSDGMLLFSNSGTIDRINDNATMTLNANGSTTVGFNTAGLSEYTAGPLSVVLPGMGALTLASNSIIDLSNGASIIAFSDSLAQAANWNGTLSIYNWSGNPLTGNGTDQLYFGTNASGLAPSQLLQISFYSDSGSTFLGFGSWGLDNDGEVVPLAPVPEPSTWVGAALALAAVGFTQRKRFAKG